MKRFAACAAALVVFTAAFGAAMEHVESSAVLAHRWSFSGDCVDAVTGEEAEMSGNPAFSADGSSLVLPGGSYGAGAVGLGGALPVDGRAVTIEIWATHLGAQKYSRVFDCHAERSEYFCMTWTNGRDVHTELVGYNIGSSAQNVSNTMAPYSFNVEYHISMKIVPNRRGGSILTWAKRLASTGKLEKRMSVEFPSWTTAVLADAAMWLGRSMSSNDMDANAAYNEVRIWNCELSDAQLAANASAGPDGIPATVEARPLLSKAVWTGAAGDGSVANPANWLCSDWSGNAIPGALPDARTAVFLSGETALQIPASTPLVCGEMVCDGVVLTADCDWRGLDAGVVTGTLEMNGRNLRVGGLPGGCTVTSTSVSVNLVANGSFEAYTGTLGNKNTWNYVSASGGAVPTDWSCAPSTGLAKTGSPWISSAMPDGVLGLFFQGDSRAWQTVEAPMAGTYMVTFQYAARPSYGEGRIHAEIDGAAVTSVDLGTDVSFRSAQALVELSAGSHEFALRHEQLGAKDAGFYCAAVDAVALTLVAAPVELHVDVPEGEAREIDEASISGVLKLVKDGAGELAMSKAGQSYGLGTEVAAGTLVVASPTALGSAAVTAGEGATARLAPGADGCGNDFVMEGGTLAMAGDGFDGAEAEVSLGGAVTLRGDATVLFDTTSFQGASMRIAAAGGLTAEAGDLSARVRLTDSEGCRVEVADDGGAVRVLRTGVPATAEWKGGATGAADDPASWTCRNAAGEEIAGALPAPFTEAIFAGDFAVQMPPGATAAWGRTSFGDGARLVADCDWRGLGALDVSGVLDLAGRRLLTAGLSGDGTITSVDADPELVANGGFESYTGTLGYKNTWNYVSASGGAVPTDWNCEDCKDLVGLAKTDPMWWISSAVPEGVLGLFFQSDSRVWQTVNVPEAGRYRVSFYYAARKNYGDGRIHVEVDGEELLAVDVQTVLDFRHASAEVDLEAGEHVLTLRHEQMGEKDPGNYCAAVDGVSMRRAAAPGELHVEVPAGKETENSSVTLAGRLRLVKDGAGVFVAAKAGQTYHGGTEAAAGTLRIAQGTYCSVAKPLGWTGTELKVDSGASLDMNGSYAAYHRVVLSGGTLANTVPVATDAYAIAMFSELSLEADSTVSLVNSYGLVAASHSLSALDLRGHTLTVEGTGLFYLGNSVGTEGRIVLDRGGTMEFVNKGSDLGSVEIDERSGGRVRVWTNIAGTCTVGGYTCAAATACGDSGLAGVMKVRGVFRPDTGFFCGCELQDGATLDLSGREGTFDAASGNAGSETYQPHVAFAPGAAVTVNLAGRTDLAPLASAEAPYAVKWAAPPEGTRFSPDEATARRGFRLESRDGGLALLYFGGTVIYLR